MDRLEAATEPFVLVVAPSGYGKTNLLSEWARSTSAEVAWLTCVQADHEPTHFWPRLTSTLEDRWPAMGSDSALVATRPSWQDDALVTALGRDLVDVPGPGAIVVDDSQFAEPSQAGLVNLARELPRHMRLVMASQHNPVFSTTRLQLEGVLSELRADELAFSGSEVDELFSLAGVDLGADDRQQLHRLTEGWPAGLQMALLALRHSANPREVVDAFSSTTKETSDYLANEVINRLPPELVNFMAQISVLDEFDAELCEAVTGAADSRALLAEVVANDLFVYQLDFAGERFRFHQMFAAYLRSRLKSRGDQAYQLAHDRATEALHQRGDRLGALRHAMAVSDVRRAADIVTESVGKILEVDDARQAIAVARAWLVRMGDEAMISDPEQFLQFVFVLATFGQRDAQRWLVAFDQAHPSNEPAVDAFRHATWSNLYANRGDAERALAHNTMAFDAAETESADGLLWPKLVELPLQAVQCVPSQRGPLRR